MAQIRWRVVVLLLWLSIFFNVERLDLDLPGFDALNLPSSLYAIGLLGAIAALTPMFQRRHVGILLGLMIVLHIAMLAIMGKPIFGGVHIYLTLTGVLMLICTVLAAYSVGRCLSEFISAVETVTFSEKGSPMHYEHEGHELVGIEMIKSRRTQRPLSLVMIQANATSVNMLMHRLIQDVQHMMMQRYLLTTIARVLSRYVRRTDILIEGTQDGRLVVLAPETSPDGAVILGERLTQMAEERLGISASYSIAAFPEQALTYEGLINIAEQRLNELEPELQETAVGAPRGVEPPAVSLTEVR
jgi:GGDEF domain-containing protein